MKISAILSFLLMLLIVVACDKEVIPEENDLPPDISEAPADDNEEDSEDDEEDSEDDEEFLIVRERIHGVVQKGPFLNGASVFIFELDSALKQTGKVFSTNISYNTGSFEVTQVELASQFVEIKADGYYFNEITGKKSTSQLSLHALADLTDESSLNVNILSHLEKDRIKHLVARGSTFGDAKKQAQAEVLEIFSFEKPDISSSELLDISKEGDDNAILLAISVIMQGFRSEAGLSELMANIIDDIRENGQLNRPDLGTHIINHASVVKLENIRTHLETRYNEMNTEASIAEFETYINHFLDNAPYENTYFIEYPEFSDYGENILFDDKSHFHFFAEYSLAANLPEGTELKIIMEGGEWGYRVMPDGPRHWSVSQYDQKNKSQIFTAESGKENYLMISLHVPMSYWFDSTNIVDGNYIDPPMDTIMIKYFENNSEKPTRTKSIYLEGSQSRKSSEKIDVGMGIPKTPEEMMQQATYEGWEFNNIWTIDEGKTYPYLQWQK